MLAERAAREHHNGTLFEEETELAEDEPDEESDLILHDDDDDAEGEDEVHDEEDVVPESTGTAVTEAFVLSSTVAAEVARAERFLYLRVAYGRHPPSPLSPPSPAAMILVVVANFQMISGGSATLK